MATKTEQARIKAIPGKAMKEAIVSINTYLAENEKTLVVFEKQTKAVAVENLLAPIVEAIKANEAENLPADVIAFYNEHLVVEEPTKKPAKEKSAKKPAKEKAPKRLSNEDATYGMVKAGKSDADILKHFTGVYAGKGKDAKFIAKRAAIYTNIAKRKFASEDAKFAKTWEAEKEAAKPKKEKPAPKPKKEKAAGTGKSADTKITPKKVKK